MGTSLDLFDALKGISGYMDLPQEIKDMLPALVDTAGTVISYGDLDTKSSQELKDMMDLPFVDEQPPGEPLELDEELIGEEIVIWTTYPFADAPKYYTSSKSPSALLSK